MKTKLKSLLLALLLFPCTLSAQSQPSTYDVLIKNGTIYNGTGSAPIKADVGIKGDRIVAIGNLRDARATTVIDAGGLAVAPGFINMLSWSGTTLIADYRSQSEIRQGVTTEIFGEGSSMGPLNAEMKQRMIAQQGDFKFEVPWTTLAEYLTYMEKRGVAPNVASFIGAGTVRTYVIGLEDKKGDARAAQRDARGCAARDGSGCAGDWFVPDLCARYLRQH